MAHDVFISYSSEDKPTADAVCATLEAEGIRCWIAPRDILPGQEWGQAIIEGIADARVMVVVFSHHSNKSRQVMREVERAVNGGLAVLPFRIEDVTPSGSMEYFLSSTHWLDALTDNMEEHILHLAANVQTLLGRKAETAKRRPTAPPAGKPKKKRPAVPDFFSGQLKFISGAVAAILAVVIFVVLFDFGGEDEADGSRDDDRAAAVAALETAGVPVLEISPLSSEDAPAAAVQFQTELEPKGETLAESMSWSFYDETGKRVKRLNEARPRLALEPGTYRLEVGRDGFKGQAVFESEPEKAISYAVVLGAGWVQPTVVPAEGGKPMSGDLRWKFFDDRVDPRKPLVQNYDDRPRLLFLGGSYRVAVTKGDAAAETTVTVRPGETVTPQLVLGAGNLALAATLREGGEVVESDMRWDVYPADQPEDKKPVARTYDARAALLVPAGRYRVRAGHHEAQAYEEVVVRPGETTEASVNLDAGALRLTAVVEGKQTRIADGVSWRVRRPATGPTGKAENVTNSYDEVPTFVMPAGDYEVTLKHGHAEKTVPVSVTAGELTEREVALSVGRLQVSVVGSDGDSDFEDKPRCEILTRAESAFDKPQRVFNFYGTAGEESVGSGAYTVRCKVAQREGSADAEVRSGEVTTVRVTVPKA